MLLIAKLVADSDQYVCPACHRDKRVPTERTCTVRPVEMFCCYDDDTWQSSHFVEVPEDTPENDIEPYAMAAAQCLFTDPSIVFFGVYSIPEDYSDWEAFNEE